MDTVFLSYTGADNRIAQRVYDDLRRSGYDVWSYEKNGVPGTDFRGEYQDEIRSRRYFCLLDSPESRASPHVRVECALAVARRQTEPGFGILPCLITSPSGDWWAGTPLFDNQLGLAYINLATDYDLGMARLCRHMGNHDFFPFSELPEDTDFFEEISRCPLGSSSVADAPGRAARHALYEELHGLYRSFREDCVQSPRRAHVWIEAIIARLEKAGAREVATPWVALGVLEGARKDDVAAARAFEQAAAHRPDYARAWAASAGAHLALGQYQKALAHYRRCRTLLVPGHPDRDNLPIVVFGLAQVLLKLGLPEEATRELDAEWNEVAGNGNVLQLRAQLHLQAGQIETALALLERAVRSFDQAGRPVPLDVLLTLAQAYHELSRSADEDRVVNKALALFERDPEALRSIVERRLGGAARLPLAFLRKAVQLAPDSFIYRGELASLLYADGDRAGARAEAEPCRWLEDQLPRLLSPRERYYQGLAFHILGEVEVARHTRDRAARADVIIAGWPAYEPLLSGGRR